MATKPRLGFANYCVLGTHMLNVLEESGVIGGGAHEWVVGKVV